jgi:Icc-related predicted phosphoesterase
MKIQVVSDLHLEFDDPPELNNAGADVLVLGGDTCLAEHIYRNPRKLYSVDGTEVDPKQVMIKDWHGWDVKKWREFFDHVNRSWDHVIYIIGNHEHYSGRWDRTEDVLREELEHYPNIHLLEMDRLVIDDMQFLGASLWTDFNRQDPLTVLAARDLMNDYKAIANFNQGSYRKLHPNTTLAKHNTTVAWLGSMLAAHDMKTVVCTHHAPSLRSTHPKYASQHHMNGCFVSDCDFLIEGNPNVVLWTHGHVHDPWDYNIGQCRVVCNPRGYPGEGSRMLFNPNLVIEV